MAYFLLPLWRLCTSSCCLTFYFLHPKKKKLSFLSLAYHWSHTVWPHNLYWAAHCEFLLTKCNKNVESFKSQSLQRKACSQTCSADWHNMDTNIASSTDYQDLTNQEWKCLLEMWAMNNSLYKEISRKKKIKYNFSNLTIGCFLHNTFLPDSDDL